ncbi:unnamed protein product [marine sediment metagenome]|uniref:Uncharacterized protein n=1 Tax=marine sediment metagenome TaxID=412755 RepID=X1RLC2_9ZZZZ
MVMPRLRERETEPEQPLPTVRVCWDELFDFLQKLFKPKAARAWTVLENLDAETSTNYKKVFETQVEAGFEGVLDMISLYSENPDSTQWYLEIAGQVQFADKKTFAALTLSYSGLTIHTEQKIKLMVKTDGTATNIAGALSGQLRYLGK